MLLGCGAKIILSNLPFDILGSELTMNKLLASVIIGFISVITLFGRMSTVSAAKETQMLINGSLQATENDVIATPTLFVDAVGSGDVTQLGLYTARFQANINTSTTSGPAIATFTFANGDSIRAQGSGQILHTALPTLVTIVETYAITGGTGQFDHATGSLIINRLLDRTTGISSGTISGNVIIP